MLKQNGTYMKKIFIMFALGLLTRQTTQAQGTMTYLSNLGQPSAGSVAVGSNSWLAAGFETGTNSSGYLLNSFQLEMTNASGTPSGFTVMLYNRAIGGPPDSPGSRLGTLDGSLNPVTGGIFTYTPASRLTLSPDTFYFIVLTAGTAVADGAYEWSEVGANSYNPSGGWANTVDFTSSNGSIPSWNSISGDYVQFAINVMDVPEPGVLGLFCLGGLFFLWHRRKLR
jgi:hypothetical protein